MKGNDRCRQYHELRCRGLSQSKAAMVVGVSRSTAWRYDKALHIPGRNRKGKQRRLSEGTMRHDACRTVDDGDL